MASITKEQITAALKKLGPVSPGELADHLQVDRSALGHHLKPLLDDGTLKAAGSTVNRRVALAEQKLEDTKSTPQPGKKPAKAKKAKRAKAKPRAPKPAPTPARDFLTAITADKHLVVISDDDLHIYSETETASIRELMEEV